MNAILNERQVYVVIGYNPDSKLKDEWLIDGVYTDHTEAYKRKEWLNQDNRSSFIYYVTNNFLHGDFIEDKG